jgi:hypothetical protein
MIHRRSKTIFHFLALLLFSSLFPFPALAAGGGGGTVDGGGNTTISPIQTNSYNQNPFSSGYSNGFNGYNSGGGNCGIQAYITTGIQNSSNGVSITTNNTTTIGTSPSNIFQVTAGIIFNSQKCLNQQKALELQTTSQLKQTSIQVCGPLRANLVQKDPEITKQRLDEVCPLE